MNNKPIIGIVSRPITSNSNRNMLGVYETYQKAVTFSGGIPLSILPTSMINYDESNHNTKNTTEENQDLIQILKLCDGIILPGGDEAYFYDYFIADYCYKNDIPVLGICLGMQVMCRYMSDTKLIKVNNHNMTNHNIYIDKNSVLFKILKKDKLLVNSRHLYQVNNAGIYDVVALSPDNVIEAVELKNKKLNIGVEWHPEDLEDKKIFKYFINKCKVRK